MKKNLVIVESPAKAKTISKFLGKDFVVLSCMGHIIDLPAKELGVEVEDNFKAHYVIIPGRKKVVSELKKEAKATDTVYIATDPDREGEAIGWHIKEHLKKSSKHFLRVVFHEITKRAVQDAFQHPHDFDVNKIQAQQARRILDRIVGYFLSPLLWRKLFRGLSAGRVQSVALRIIVEREREIEKFIPEEFWNIVVDLQKEQAPAKADEAKFQAKLEKENGKKVLIKTKEESEAIAQKIKGCDFIVSDISISERKKSAPPPLITSTLQQEAFNKLGFSTTKTMFIAQQLYEGIELGEEGSTGLITYMRTDSARISDIALQEIRSLISKTFGGDYLPETPNVFKSRATAQEAHEAIRPSDPWREPKSVKQFLTPDQLKLYELIWKRAIASQMKPAISEIITVDIQAGEYGFRASGSRILFPGYSLLYSNTGENEEEKATLPKLDKQERLKLLDVATSQHFTKPPPRYSEGSLVRALEEIGVGRPSTYSPVIRTITTRNYVRRIKGYLYPTELGFRVNDMLVEYFSNIVDIEFTARMEEELDKVEEGTYNWVSILNEFYPPFKEKLDFASRTIQKEVIFSDEICELCGKQMVVKWGRKGKFLSCSDYPRCKFSKSISTGKPCPEPGCGGELIERRSGRGKFFYGCSNYPKCTYTANKLPE